MPLLDRLYQIRNEGTLSQQECQQINAELASLKVEAIPLDQRDNVADYLTAALNHDSVDIRFTLALDDLLKDLQNNA